MKSYMEYLETFDIIGDIAIISCKTDDKEIYYNVAKEILSHHKNIKTVYRISGETFGQYRIRPLEFLLGEKKELTLHKENKCFFYINVKKVYFNPRLSGERTFVINFVKSNEFIESVLDMFCGVGPFAIELAKHTQVKYVWACDINPECIKLLKKNIEINKVQDKVYPLLIDSSKLHFYFKKVFDLIIMNHPSESLYYLDYALKMLKNKGFVILYFFEERKKIEKSINKIEKKYNVKVHSYKSVKSVSASKDFVRCILTTR